MQKTACLMREKAKKLLTEKQVDAVLGWQCGQFSYDNTPFYFTSPEQADNLVWNSFCGSNLSKYLIAAGKQNKKVAVFLKPCDTLSFNQLLKDNRVTRENVVIIGLKCDGMLDINKLKANAIKGILSIEEIQERQNANQFQLKIRTLYGDKSFSRREALLEKCLACRRREPIIFDELLEEIAGGVNLDYDRFAPVTEIEAMTNEERFAFWQEELSKCIRCNACREVCPACSCEKCIFDNKNSGIDSKVNSNSFEEQLFHIIRAYHVAGRCTDCGECSRVCPQDIPLHLINRKFIKDINEFYGEYQAGEDIQVKAPLLTFNLNDVEPTILGKRRG